jgi:hypothetical protein
VARPSGKKDICDSDFEELFLVLLITIHSKFKRIMKYIFFVAVLICATQLQAQKLQLGTSTFGLQSKSYAPFVGAPLSEGPVAYFSSGLQWGRWSTIAYHSIEVSNLGTGGGNFLMLGLTYAKDSLWNDKLNISVTGLVFISHTNWIRLQLEQPLWFPFVDLSYHFDEHSSVQLIPSVAVNYNLGWSWALRARYQYKMTTGGNLAALVWRNSGQMPRGLGGYQVGLEMHTRDFLPKSDNMKLTGGIIANWKLSSDVNRPGSDLFMVEVQFDF